MNRISDKALDIMVNKVIDEVTPYFAAEIKAQQEKNAELVTQRDEFLAQKTAELNSLKKDHEAVINAKALLNTLLHTKDKILRDISADKTRMESLLKLREDRLDNQRETIQILLANVKRRSKGIAHLEDRLANQRKVTKALRDENYAMAASQCPYDAAVGNDSGQVVCALGATPLLDMTVLRGMMDRAPIPRKGAGRTGAGRTGAGRTGAGRTGDKDGNI